MDSQVVLLSGASGGLGQALIAEVRRAAPDLKIAAVGRDRERLESMPNTADALIVADVSTHAGAHHAVAECQRTIGLATHYAHCVGSIFLGPAGRTTEAQYRDTMRVNLDSAFFMLAAVTAALKADTSKPPASLCFVSTVAAQIGLANHDAIAAAKGGLEAMVRASAATHASAGIRVNAVAPGLMDTPAAARFLANPMLKEASAKQVPLGTVGTPVEVAKLMWWLLSSDAARVTGQIWALDGGFAAIRPLVR